jgi:uncharacterized membrane-anchored protein
MNTRHTFFLSALLGLILFLGGFILWQERIVLLGTEMVLATRPVDPRDLFRGEYVILRYEIERDEKVLETLGTLENETALYLKLEADADGIARVVEVNTAPDMSSGVWLKGIVTGNQVQFPSLEQYFVPEGAGLPIERIGAALRVRVAVWGGEARVVGLLDKDLNPINPRDYIEE